MSINFNDAFGIHEVALTIRAQRAEVLANNLANADTPNFKARDIDFSKALQDAQSASKSRLQTTHNLHFSGGGENFAHQIPGLSYRVPHQADTGDGNSVDAQYEQTQFAENAMQYEASLRLLDGKIKGLMTALRGE